MVTEPPRLYPRADNPSLVAVLPFHAEKLGLVDDDPVHPHILDLLLLYLDQFGYLGSLPPRLGLGRAVAQLGDLFVFGLGGFPLEDLQFLGFSAAVLERRNDERVASLTGLGLDELRSIPLQKMGVDGPILDHS